MKVAVITPFHNETLHWLTECQNSVKNQTYACDHFLIGDAARIQPCLPARVINLPVGVADYSDTPRAIGSFYAAGLQYDAIAYLDGDNCFHPNHIESLVHLLSETGAPVLTSRRAYIRLDGSYMAEDLTSDGEKFCDTNCLFLTRPAFSLLSHWALMDRAFHPIDDRVMWYHILQAGLKRAHTGRVTVAYRATHQGHYRDLGETPPNGAKSPDNNPIGVAFLAWEAKGFPPLRMEHKYCGYRDRSSEVIQ